MLSGKYPTELEGRVHFRWTNKGFRYLGIIITPLTSQLFDANYGKLINEITKDMTRWEILPLTLSGRIETVRMNVMPRLLFLFQSLPSIVSDSILKSIDKIISKFIWQNKKARIKYKTLLCPKEKGGLNLPNIKYYYYSAQLKPLIMWIMEETDTIWVGMEQSS